MGLVDRPPQRVELAPVDRPLLARRGLVGRSEPAWNATHDRGLVPGVVDSEGTGDGLDVALPYQLARVLAQDRDQRLGRPRPTLGAGPVGPSQRLVDAELEEVGGTVERLEQRARVVAPHVGGVAAGGEGGDAQLDLEALLPLVPPLGGAPTGGVG